MLYTLTIDERVLLVLVKTLHVLPGLARDGPHRVHVNVVGVDARRVTEGSTRGRVRRLKYGRSRRGQRGHGREQVVVRVGGRRGNGAQVGVPRGGERRKGPTGKKEPVSGHSGRGPVAAAAGRPRRQLVALDQLIGREVGPERKNKLIVVTDSVWN